MLVEKKEIKRIQYEVSPKKLNLCHKHECVIQLRCKIIKNINTVLHIMFSGGILIFSKKTCMLIMTIPDIQYLSCLGCTLWDHCILKHPI